MTSASPWFGLGSLKGSGTTAPPPARGDDDEDAFGRPSVQRTIPAAGAPSVVPANAITSAFSHPFRTGAGSAETSADDSPADTPEEKQAMPKTPKAPTAVRNIQHRLCAAVAAAGGNLARSELAKQLPDLEPKQLSQGLFQATANSRLQKQMTEAGYTFKLTASGRTWLNSQCSAEEPLETPAQPRLSVVRKSRTTNKPASTPATRKAKKTKAPRAKPGKKIRKAPAAASATFAEPSNSDLAIRPFEPVVERSFRCAVFSDGAFHLAKNGQAIDLTAAEFAEALRYVERMAEQPGA